MEVFGWDFEGLKHVEVHKFGRASLIDKNSLNHGRTNPECDDQGVVVGELDSPEVLVSEGDGPP